MNQQQDMNADTDKPSSFEDAFTQLETVVRQLEGGNLTLDKSMELFEEGMKLSKECSEMLNKAELRISKLRDDYGLPSAASNAPSNMNPTKAGDDDLENLPW